MGKQVDAESYDQFHLLRKGELMEKTICFACIEDSYLKEIIKTEGTPLKCSVCDEDGNNAITVKDLGKLMEPIMREHFSLGESIRMFGEEEDWWEQDGEPISSIVQELLGQYFDFEDEIVDAVIEAEDCWPPDGDEAFWDETSLYVQKRIKPHRYNAEWESALYELKHTRRFFSSAARNLFDELFDGIEDLKIQDADSLLPIIRNLPAGSKLFRARIFKSKSMLKDIHRNPFDHVGPPPSGHAQPGRMNPEGVAVFYGALEEETCLAETRPALGDNIAIITLETTEPLRILDFSLLKEIRHGKALSYFQSDFTAQIERVAFMQQLHRRISQPIVPGNESDYLITQILSEYLAHVYHEPLDGILFNSTQHTKGTNIVLFANINFINDSSVHAFRLSYIQDSIRFFSTYSIEYKHHELNVLVKDDGELFAYSDFQEELDDQ